MSGMPSEPEAAWINWDLISDELAPHPRTCDLDKPEPFIGEWVSRCRLCHHQEDDHDDVDGCVIAWCGCQVLVGTR
jgi:hypothetical protein